MDDDLWVWRPAPAGTASDGWYEGLCTRAELWAAIRAAEMAAFVYGRDRRRTKAKSDALFRARNDVRALLGLDPIPDGQRWPGDPHPRAELLVAINDWCAAEQDVNDTEEHEGEKSDDHQEAIARAHEARARLYALLGMDAPA